LRIALFDLFRSTLNITLADLALPLRRDGLDPFPIPGLHIFEKSVGGAAHGRSWCDGRVLVESVGEKFE
jgi:hypothetical protein